MGRQQQQQLLGDGRGPACIRGAVCVQKAAAEPESSGGGASRPRRAPVLIVAGPPALLIKPRATKHALIQHLAALQRS